MKNYLLIFLSLFSFSCTTVPVADQEFISDLGSVNNRISGELFLDYFNGNLNSLTYRDYLDHLKNNELYSGEGITEKIKRADKYFFLSDSSSFVISLYYGVDNLVISDNSGTPFTDTVIAVSGTPEMHSLVELSRYVLNK
jgi:hypothetical protein